MKTMLYYGAGCASASGPLHHRRHQGCVHGPGSGAADGADGDP